MKKKILFTLFILFISLLNKSALSNQKIMIKAINERVVYLQRVEDKDLSSKKENTLDVVLNQAMVDGKFAFILAKLEEQHLPRSLALIPFIESHYQLNARSNKGAGGLWQLMPATSKELGLSLQDRFELNTSTIAALRYFTQLHQQLGDWTLAIAAYHAGIGRVQKIRLTSAKTSPQDLPLPQETKAYLACFDRLKKHFGEEVW